MGVWMEQEIMERLKVICAEILSGSVEPDSITMDTNLRGELGMTSLYMIWMALAIETEFDIRLSDIRLEDLVTVGDICRFIAQKSASV